MKKIISLQVALLVVAINLCAQPPAVNPTVLKPSSPESAGFSSERLGRIDEMVNGYITKGRLNGAVALVIRDGKVVYHKAFGYNDIDTKQPMAKDAIFRIASQTKAITSVAVMMLFEEGRFLLDDPVSRYIPEFAKPQVIEKYNDADTTYTTVPAKREVTIRDLLTHTSGIGYAQIGNRQMNAIYYKAGVVAGIGVKDITLAEKMRILGKLPLFHQPGEKWTYGLNTDVLGYLVEVVSGLSLDDFLRKRLFEPLGMKDTYFYLPKEKHQRLVMLYSDDSLGRPYKMKETYNLYGTMYRDFPNLTNGTYYSGGAGLSSTIYDYAIFLQMLLNGGTYNGKRILSRNAVRMMTMNQIGEIARPNNPDKFGLGFGVVTEKGSTVLQVNEGTYEWGGMFATMYWVDPKERLIGLLYRNVYPTRLGPIGNQFKVLTYAAIND